LSLETQSRTVNQHNESNIQLKWGHMNHHKYNEKKLKHFSFNLEEICWKYQKKAPSKYLSLSANSLSLLKKIQNSDFKIHVKWDEDERVI